MNDISVYDLIIFMLFLRILLDFVTVRRIHRMRKGIKDLFDLLDHADFRNGNTHPDFPGSTDEGEVGAAKVIEKIRAELGADAPK